MQRPILMMLISAILAGGCAREQPPPLAAAVDAPSNDVEAPAAVRDEHSYSEPHKVRTDDLALELAINFDARQIGGTATYTLEWLDTTASRLVLDTRDLNIEKVEAEGANGRWIPLSFTLDPKPDPILGSRLTIQTPQRPAKVRVTYTTSPQASGLQWLEPAMTAGKRQPFMFSQSQQIHARSWVPLQDTPQVRFTYSARVTAPADTMVLMSADNDPQAARDGDYSFKMPQPIPSYLLAIAAGDLVFKPISARSGIWAEPAMLDQAVAEFEDTEKMIGTAEALYGPYRWDRYDLLVLPPSFPYGGMENPRLTFATPTVIVGDKSLVSLIAHELAHSWSGNLVTFATARHGWLNEGVTTYVQGRIIEALYGRDLAEMENMIDRAELKREFETLDRKLQVLTIEPGDLPDPDAASSASMYVKGAWFMQFLEQRFGRTLFDPWLRGYFDHFAFQSITSEQFREHLQRTLVDRHPGRVTMEEVDRWLYAPGVPADAPRAESRRFSVVDSARLAWLGSQKLPVPALTSQWSTQEWAHLLEGLTGPLSHDQLRQLDQAYHFTGTANGEIAMRWYPLTVRNGYAQARPEMARFLTRVGRRKLIMPIYEALAQSADGLRFAEQVFAEARPGYHPITAASVQAVIDKAKAKAKAGAAGAI